VIEDLSHVVSVYDGSDNWKQNFAWSDEVDGIQMLEQKDVLDFDTDGNTTEVTRSFFHRNALGSVMEVTDMNQASVVSYRYEPYGKVSITRLGVPQTADPLGQHWTFTGRFLDEESGLCYYRARYYDAVTGRFLQRDPLGYAAGPNLFDYTGSNPVNRQDASGLTHDEEHERKKAMKRLIDGLAEEIGVPSRPPGEPPSRGVTVQGVESVPDRADLFLLWWSMTPSSQASCGASRSSRPGSATSRRTARSWSGRAGGCASTTGSSRTRSAS
jgi:RHS repeat-associated protein